MKFGQQILDFCICFLKQINTPDERIIPRSSASHGNIQMSVIAERPVFVYFLARFVRRHASFNCRSVIIDWPLIGVWREIPWPFSTFGVHCSFHGFARHVCFAPFFYFQFIPRFASTEFQMANYSVDVTKQNVTPADGPRAVRKWPTITSHSIFYVQISMYHRSSSLSYSTGTQHTE